MDLSIIENFSQRELEQFKSVCNKLLSSTFVTKKINQPPKGIVDNPDYRFLLINKSIVEDYLSLLDWRLYHNDTNGFFYVDNSNEIVYYLPIQDYFIANPNLFELLNSDQKTINVHIPLDNVVSEDDFDLRQIAKSVYVDGPASSLRKV